jgi:hypothetical protein
MVPQPRSYLILSLNLFAPGLDPMTLFGRKHESDVFEAVEPLGRHHFWPHLVRALVQDGIQSLNGPVDAREFWIGRPQIGGDLLIGSVTDDGVALKYDANQNRHKNQTRESAWGMNRRTLAAEFAADTALEILTSGVGKRLEHVVVGA